jgi:hypothetical protein
MRTVALENPFMKAGDTGAVTPPTDDEVDRIVAAGPQGAIAVAGVATLVVTAIWFGFYFLFFLPRGVAH